MQELKRDADIAALEVKMAVDFKALRSEMEILRYFTYLDTSFSKCNDLFVMGFLPVTLIHYEMMLGYFDRLKIQHMQHCAMVAMTVALLCTLISPMLYFALKYKYIVYPRTLSAFDSRVPASPNSRRYLSQIGKIKPLLTCSFSQVTQAMPSLSRSLSQP